MSAYIINKIGDKMAHLESENAKEIITDNQQTIYHLSEKKYPCITHYLKGSVYHTLLDVMKFIKSVNVIIYKHKYVFVLDNKRLTYKVRKKSGGVSVSSRQINLLCAIGLINKQYQDDEDMLEVNKIFLGTHPDKKRPVNAFYFRRYTEKELQRCEQRAERLLNAGVTAGNMGFNCLMLNGLEDIATEVYPKNNRTAPEKKTVEFSELMMVLQFLIEEQGYATRQQIRDNLLIEENELDKIFQIYRSQLKDYYNYKKPTKQQKEKLGLQNQKYIYTEKER